MKFFGKYRGVVLNNSDPMLIGRMLVQVPDVPQLAATTWAMPCVPVAGPQYGMFALPSIGSDVWVEFERGDPSYPIWAGCFWSSAADVPTMLGKQMPGTQAIVLQTPLGNGLSISDLPGPGGGILLKSTTGATISISDMGILIENGRGASLTLIGPSTVINAGALEVI